MRVNWQLRDSQKKDDPPLCFERSRRLLTEDRHDDAQGNCRGWVGSWQRSRLFADCLFEARIRLLAVYVKGHYRTFKRKTAEAIALKYHTAPRTLLTFLGNRSKWMKRSCGIVASRSGQEHAHPEAIAWW